ncbi:sensor histidine kinase [Nocardioides sp. Root151]|uniref:sensor histidine kinase n=1 Tax=Nocardioides sp. Root151 TaxID=1736475 RepID=UPI00070316B1|nr:histidine kinase [Nocardioides sp. Root151]KQZ75519.1 hypothetical protein ASD66_03990 [Nocardioides sp. Root151]
MSVDLGAFVRALRARIEDKGASRGLVYPWWIAVITSVGQVGAMLVAAAQRDVLWTPQPVVLAVLLIAVPHALHFVLRDWLHWSIGTAFGLAGVGWMLSAPMVVDTNADATVLALALLVGEMTTTEGARLGLFVGGLSVVMMFVIEGPDALELGLPSILVAFMIGYTLRWQMRAISAERDAVDGASARAALEERQRIAREIHDLVAHSLSVTLLHVTGARRALTEDRDVDDAVHALEDAERIGRQAMADIRRTVGVLNNGPRSDVQAALPAAGDIPGLVDDIRAAGLEVDFAESGDPSGVPESAGLCLFRAVQESLTNVARHAPSAPAQVRVDYSPRGATLTVRNPAPAAARRGTGGSGLAGMAARVEQFGGTLYAGRDPGAADQWLVEVDLPGSAEWCVVKRMKGRAR